MSSYPAYPHNSLYGAQTSAPAGIPTMPPGVSSASLGIQGPHPQHGAGIPLAHQQAMATASGDPGKSMLPHQHTHGMVPPQHSHPAWCYLPPMSSASILPVQAPDKDEKFNFGFTTTELEARIQKDAIDFAVHSAAATNHRQATSNMAPVLVPPQPQAVMQHEQGGGPSMTIDTTNSTPEIPVPVAVFPSTAPKPKPAKPRKPAGRTSSAKKRLRQPEFWKKNISKVKKIRGEAHLSRNGTVIPAKKVEEVDCAACSFLCNENFSEDLRGQLFAMFYSLGSNESQKQFVCQNVTEEATKPNVKNKTADEGTPKENRRKVSRKYYLPDNDNSRKQVCSRFFRGTLCVGKSFITHALKHKQFGCYMGQERRGMPHNKTPSEQITSAKAHIEHLLNLEGKGGKKKSAKKRCAEKGLNVAKMYELFKNECAVKNVAPVSLSIYRRVFHTEF